MSKLLTFDDVLIEPAFSEINSRKHVDISTDLGFGTLKLPVISANMDTVTSGLMAQAMKKSGGIGCLHRFQEIDANNYMAESVNYDCIVSFGLGDYEEKRASFLYQNGARRFCLDVAHGAQIQVVNQLKQFKIKYPDAWICVGNFGNIKSLRGFMNLLKEDHYPDAIKIGIGPGSACLTRVKTGCGYPQLTAIYEISESLDMSGLDDISVIADGGMKSSGDIAKALAAGADAVMLGGMLAGTEEAPGKLVRKEGDIQYYKKYRGSASKDSYEDQGKSWSCAEGDSFIVPYKGPVDIILSDIAGGLKSAFTYTGSSNLTEFQLNANLIEVSSNTLSENTSHGNLI